MIIPNHVTFRHRFAVLITETVTPVSFLDTNPDAIRRLDGGDFAAAGYEAAMRVRVLGSGAGNDGYYYPASVTAGVNGSLVLPAGINITAEIGATIEFEAVHVDPGGNEVWPASNVRLAASGFGNAGSTLTGIPTPLLTNVTIAVTCNAGAADGVFGTDEYDWYLSQRTDVAGSQPLVITQKADAGGSSYSGSVDIALAASLGFAPGANLSVADLIGIFKYCHLYVQRISDKAIQWVDLLKAQIATQAT